MSLTVITRTLFDGYDVSRHDDGGIVAAGNYIEMEHALFNAINYYLFRGKTVRVHANTVQQIVIEEVDGVSATTVKD